MTDLYCALAERPWAISRPAMQTMLGILIERPDVEAVAAKLGRPMQNASHRAEIRDGIAVLHVEGPLFRKANLVTECSGATSIGTLATDFHAALANPQVESIVLNINSPGGQADGVGELAQAIYEARGVKPTAAYIGGIGASGAYWLAAATERVVIHETASAGSIGVVAMIPDNREAMQRDGIRTHEIISSQSPAKGNDVATTEGKARMQGLVDDMAAVFIDRVAQYRNTSPDAVIANYGKGFVLTGQRAVLAGMADSTGSFEGLLADMKKDSSVQLITVAAQQANTLLEGRAVHVGGDKSMTDQEVAAMRVEAARAEQARIRSIFALPEAQGRDSMVRHLALETDFTLEVSRGLLAASPAVVPVAVPGQEQDESFMRRMRQVDNPVVGVNVDSGVSPEDEDDREIAAIMRFIPQANRRAGA